MPPLTTKPIHFGSFVVTAQVFHLTSLSYALVNIKPLLPGHILVCPVRRVPRIKDLTASETSDLFLTVQRVSRMLERVYSASALNVAVQDGPDAGQSVPHVHAHIIPRHKADLDHKGGGDKIYEMLESQDGDLDRHLKEKQKRIGGLKVDADEDRKPRSEEEMNKEAEWLAGEMEKQRVLDGEVD